MQDIPDEAVRFIEQNAPDFITAVQTVQGKRGKSGAPVRIFLTLDAFVDDPFLLYACLWYSATQGVACTFVPIR
jgi:hypothetical protein